MSEFRTRIAGHLRAFVGDERAATAIEYALIASGISLAIIATVWALGTSIKTNLYGKITQAFN